MGGKPWTSKGCVDCRRRKVKCDEQRPQCGRCLKAGIKCQGWEKHRNFIGAASIPEARRQKTNNLQLCQANRDRQSRYTPAAQHLASSGAPSSRLPMDVHSTQAMRNQVLSSFMQSFFPGTRSLSSSPNFDDSIFHSNGALAQKSQMTERALSAMSCLFLGKVNHNTSIFNHGLYLYHTAIQQLTNIMRKDTHRYINEILYAVFLFQKIDVIHAPHGLKPWGTHIAGMSTLLQCYRSKSSSDPIIATIYSHWQKLQIILASTGVSLSKSEYDYLMEPTNGDPLLGILQTTVLIGDLRSLLDSNTSSCLDHIAYKTILRKCSRIQNELMASRQHGQVPTEPRRPMSANDPGILAPDHLFGFAYDFPSPNHALLFILYWTNLTLLQPLVPRANYLLRSHTSSMKGLHTTPQFGNLDLLYPERCADNVARAMSYCLQERMKLSFNKAAGFVLCMIGLRYVSTANREKHKWCLEVIRLIGYRGCDAASHLSKLAADQWEQHRVPENPMSVVSLREVESSLCNSNPVPPSQSELVGGIGGGSMFHSEHSLAMEGDL